MRGAGGEAGGGRRDGEIDGDAAAVPGLTSAGGRIEVVLALSLPPTTISLAPTAPSSSTIVEKVVSGRAKSMAGLKGSRPLLRGDSGERTGHWYVVVVASWAVAERVS